MLSAYNVKSFLPSVDRVPLSDTRMSLCARSNCRTSIPFESSRRLISSRFCHVSPRYVTCNREAETSKVLSTYWAEACTSTCARVSMRLRTRTEGALLRQSSSTSDRLRRNPLTFMSIAEKRRLRASCSSGFSSRKSFRSYVQRTPAASQVRALST